jgi:hypothetical protein
VEELFDQVVAGAFPETSRRKQLGTAETDEDRGSDFYEIGFWQPNLNFEMRWSLSRAQIAFVTQVAVPVTGFRVCWSPADLVLNASFFLRMASATWRRLGFYGGGSVISQLRVDQLPPYHGTPPHFYSIFYKTDFFLNRGIINGGHPTRPIAFAAVETALIPAEANVSDAVSNLTNQLLRGIGYSADLRGLRAEVGQFLSLADQIYDL